MDKISKRAVVVVGSMKSGTTSLYRYLAAHDDIYMSDIKEPHYFLNLIKPQSDWKGPGDNRIMQSMTVTTFSEYSALFANQTKEKYIGEASAMYMCFPEAIAKLASTFDDVKVIVMLRNPITRAYSSYMHLIRDGREKLSFEEALNAEEQRISENWLPIWHYKGAGKYTSQVEALINYFGTENIHIEIYEDFADDQLASVNRILNFLEIEEIETLDNEGRYNASGIPRSRIIHSLLRKSMFVKKPLGFVLGKRNKEFIRMSLMNKNLKKGPSMKSETRQYLRKAFLPEIERLETLISKDLEKWKSH